MFWLGDRYVSALLLQLPLFITQVLAAVFLESSATATLNNLQVWKKYCFNEFAGKGRLTVGWTVSASALFQTCSVLPTNSFFLYPVSTEEWNANCFFYRLVTLQQEKKFPIVTKYNNWNDLWKLIYIGDKFLLTCKGPPNWEKIINKKIQELASGSQLNLQLPFTKSSSLYNWNFN